MSKNYNENCMFPSTLTSIVFQLASVIDEGKSITTKELENELDYKNDIFEFLKNKFPNTFDFTILSQIDKEFLNDNYNDIHFAYGHKKYGIKNNGLMALLVYTIELIQRERRELSDKGHEFQLDVDPNMYSGRDDSQV